MCQGYDDKFMDMERRKHEGEQMEKETGIKITGLWAAAILGAAAYGFLHLLDSLGGLLFRIIEFVMITKGLYQ